MHATLCKCHKVSPHPLPLLLHHHHFWHEILRIKVIKCPPSSTSGRDRTSNHNRNLKILIKGPFTQAVFVAATRCNFCRSKIVLGFKHVRNPCDIAATNRTWFTRAILKLQLLRDKNCIELLRQKSPV